VKLALGAVEVVVVLDPDGPVAGGRLFHHIPDLLRDEVVAEAFGVGVGRDVSDHSHKEFRPRPAAAAAEC
jgi:hypothetical protein